MRFLDILAFQFDVDPRRFEYFASKHALACERVAAVLKNADSDTQATLIENGDKGRPTCLRYL